MNTGKDHIINSGIYYIPSLLMMQQLMVLVLLSLTLASIPDVRIVESSSLNSSLLATSSVIPYTHQAQVL